MMNSGVLRWKKVGHSLRCFVAMLVDVDYFPSPVCHKYANHGRLRALGWSTAISAIYL